MRTLSTILTVAVVVVATVAVPAAVTAQESGERTITDCTTIVEPGVYTLGEDVTNTSADTCVRIESGDVVLDGDGHTLTGDGDGTAVAAVAHEERAQEPYGNVTVRDVTVDSWGTGIEVVNTRNATVAGVAVTGADVGVRVGSANSRPGYAPSSHGATVTRSTFRGVGNGVEVVRSDRVDVVANTIAGYDGIGVHLDTASDASVRANKIVEPNGWENTAIRLSAASAADGGGTHDNVVASNLVVDGAIDVYLDRNAVTRNRLVRNDVRSGTVSVGGSRSGPTRTLVADNRFTGSGVTVWFASNVTVEDNAFTNPGEAPDASILLRDAVGNAVRNNSIRGANTGVRLEYLADGNAVVDNRVTDSDVGVGIGEDSVNNTIEGNTLAENGNGVEVSLVDSFRGGPNHVRGNDVVNNTNGLLVEATDQPLVVESNEIRSNGNGIHVQASGVCSPDAEGAELVSAHENVIADNSAYGVINENRDVLNATGNYWGASDGPSSADDPDAPFEDPATGEPADGTGAAVSEDPNATGQSNVRFDAWIRQPPTDAGTSDESTE